MFKEAYQLVREILADEQLNAHIAEVTGKHLAVIDAGVKVSAPCAAISVNGGSCSRRTNSNAEIGFIVSFILPFWGTDAFMKCIDFVDFALPIFFDYKDRHNFILRAAPGIYEPDKVGSQFWTVDFLLTVSAFV